MTTFTGTFQGDAGQRRFWNALLLVQGVQGLGEEVVQMGFQRWPLVAAVLANHAELKMIGNKLLKFIDDFERITQ